MHVSSGKTAPHPGDRGLCPEAQWVLLVRGKPLLSFTTATYLVYIWLCLHLPFLCRSPRFVSPGAQPALLPSYPPPTTLQTHCGNGGSQEQGCWVHEERFYKCSFTDLTQRQSWEAPSLPQIIF